MGSLAEAAGKFAEKLADVLDVFDLSFFVAGSAALGAFLVWLSQNGVDVPEGLSADRALVAVIAAYVLGLATYALGRAIRRKGLERIPMLAGHDNAKRMAELYAQHRLERVADFRAYANDQAALYSRLWVLVRTEPGLRETYALARRYWILGAAYDGIGFAALLWLLPVAGLDTPMPVRGLLGAGLVASALLAWRQASMYHRYQVDELAATAAHWHVTSVEPAAVDAAADDLGVDAE
ncbi:MAG: hypothetical protein ACE37F_20815 [Nannocystaceae bacterium]|nr:hypothetical protein [bacterium]